MKDKRLVRLKTEQELLDTGWEQVKNSDLFMKYKLYIPPPSDDIEQEYFISADMKPFLGTMILIKKDYSSDEQVVYMYHSSDDKSNSDTKFTITESMISEEFEIDDYPEYFL
jgi:hypothetical protein